MNDQAGRRSHSRSVPRLARGCARAGRRLGRCSRPRPDSEPGPPPREFGIIDLVEEFTALRHELKLQTKSGRGLIEQTDNTVAALRQAIDQFRSVEPKEAQAAWTAGKALAEALADLDEALVRGEREIDRARQPDRRRVDPRAGNGPRPSSFAADPGSAAVSCARTIAKSSRRSAATARHAMNCSTRSSKDMA